MKRCILLAAVAGLATCQFSWTTSSTANLYTSSSLTLDLVQRGDLAYTTIYESGDDLVEGPKWHYEAYGVRAWSNATFTLNLDVLSYYKISTTFSVNIFDVTPYKQIIKWYRPENTLMETVFDSSNTVADFWDAKIAATYSMSFLTLTTSVVETAKTLKYSMVDVLLNPSTSVPYPSTIAELQTDMAYDSDYVSVWSDSYWKVEFLKVFGIDLASYFKYYGKNLYYYRFSLLNESSNVYTDQLLWDIINYFS